MDEFEAILTELGISHYFNEFIEQGFDSWDKIVDITELDFDALDVKLGHRRKLQRKIANSTGRSPNRALAPHTRNTPNDARLTEEQRAINVGKHTGTSNGPQGLKRRYRWHPKPDENAPERPPSAYVLFLNRVRDELKGRNLSFTEIAKLVGENWRSLLPGEKESYVRQARYAKEKYTAELSEHKKTSQYREYSQYLVEFKARQSAKQRVDDYQLGRHTTARREPADPAPASTSQWLTHSRRPPVLIVPADQPAQHHLRMASIDDGPLGCMYLPARDPLNLIEAPRYPSGTGQGPPPPSISVLRSGSSQFTGSSIPFPRRRALEATYDRALPIPSRSPHTSLGSYDNQIPPSWAASLSGAKDAIDTG
jgi:hypothetical protein